MSWPWQAGSLDSRSFPGAAAVAVETPSAVYRCDLSFCPFFVSLETTARRWSRQAAEFQQEQRKLSSCASLVTMTARRCFSVTLTALARHRGVTPYFDALAVKEIPYHRGAQLQP